MKKTRQSVPQPVPASVVCSLCGESWALHAADDNGEVTTLECIRLLKAKACRPTYVPQPHPVYPARPWYWYTGIQAPCTSGGNINSSPIGAYTINAAETTTATPKVLNASAA